MGWERLGFFTDEHRPFHEPRAVSLSLQILEDFNPHKVIMGSDGMDFHTISRFTTDPRLIGTLKKERLSFWRGIHEKRDACPDAEFIYIRGNHEDRFTKYITNCMEIFGGAEYTLWGWLKLDDLNIRYSVVRFGLGPDELFPERIEVNTVSKRVQINDNLTIMHGDYIRKWQGVSARAQLIEGERMQTSLMMGHCHRGGKFEIAERGGEPIGAYECYHHQRTDMPWLSEQNPDWSWGICLAECQNLAPYHFSVEQVNYIPIGDKLRARWRGKEYYSR